MINVSNLYKSYEENHVLQGLEFQAQAGEIFGIIGKNGAGKSTFLEIIRRAPNLPLEALSCFID